MRWRNVDRWRIFKNFRPFFGCSSNDLVKKCIFDALTGKEKSCNEVNRKMV